MVLRAAGGASSSAAGWRRCLRAAPLGLFSLSFGTLRSCSCVRRRPSRLSVCPPAACSVLRPGLYGPWVFRVAMRRAGSPGRTGQGARGARRGASA